MITQMNTSFPDFFLWSLHIDIKWELQSQNKDPESSSSCIFLISINGNSFFLYTLAGLEQTLH